MPLTSICWSEGVNINDVFIINNKQSTNIFFLTLKQKYYIKINQIDIITTVVISVLVTCFILAAVYYLLSNSRKYLAMKQGDSLFEYSKLNGKF